MIEIADIIRETLAENENNAYYWDALNDRGYQLHINYNGTFVCFKATKNILKVITAAEFEHAVNYECYLNSIGEYSFYSTFNNH